MQSKAGIFIDSLFKIKYASIESCWCHVLAVPVSVCFVTLGHLVISVPDIERTVKAVIDLLFQRHRDASMKMAEALIVLGKEFRVGRDACIIK